MPRWSSLWQEDILLETQVYVLCIPSRKEHARKLMSTWGLQAELVDGPERQKIDVDAMIASKVVDAKYREVIWEDAEYVPEGKVACHLGHLDILQRFLSQSKAYALIFEDDLEPRGPTLKADLERFLSLVPRDFDLIHLGFVREDRAKRQQVNEEVYESLEALGRHAYLVTKKTAELLLQNTLPMYNHGDKMFQEVYKSRKLKAYQPREPMFFQDRIHFESELTDRWKPSRAFQPTEQDDGIRECDRLEMKRRQRSLPVPWPNSYGLLFLNLTTLRVSETGRPEPEMIARLGTIMSSGCSLVVTSLFDATYCRRWASALARCGVPWAMQALTAIQGRDTIERLQLMAACLDESPWVQSWAIVDCVDLVALDRSIAGRFRQVDPRVGLQDQDVTDVLEILKCRS